MGDFNLNLPTITRYLNNLGLTNSLPNETPTHIQGNQIDQIFHNLKQLEAHTEPAPFPTDHLIVVATLELKPPKNKDLKF